MDRKAGLAITIGLLALAAMFGGGGSGSKTELTDRQKAEIVLDCAENPDALRCR